LQNRPECVSGVPASWLARAPGVCKTHTKKKKKEKKKKGKKKRDAARPHLGVAWPANLHGPFFFFFSFLHVLFLFLSFYEALSTFTPQSLAGESRHPTDESSVHSAGVYPPSPNVRVSDDGLAS
jgi:hypothetical protein